MLFRSGAQSPMRCSIAKCMCSRPGLDLPEFLKLLVSALLLAVLCVACAPAETSYPDEINAWHATKDQFMRESSDSPVLPAQRASFPALSYFPVSADYRVPAQLTVAQSDTVISIP